MLEDWLAQEGPEWNSGMCWQEPLTGVRVCQFCCAPGKAAITALPESGCIEVLFCQSGGLQLETGQEQALLLHRHEILLLTGDVHLQLKVPESGTLQGTLVVIRAALAREGLDQFRRLGMTLDPERIQEVMQARNGCVAIRESPWCNAAFDTLADLPLEEQTHYCVFKAMELLYLLCRSSPLQPHLKMARYFDRYQVDTIRRIHTYMLEHLAAPMTIPGLARKFHLSTTSLKACFRELYGKPVHKYLRECRMRQAAALLADTEQTVLEIAIGVGYGSVSQFGVAFKEHYHMAPSQYRQAMREKKSKMDGDGLKTMEAEKKM